MGGLFCQVLKCYRTYYVLADGIAKYVDCSSGVVMFCGYQTKYQAQQQQRFPLILIYSSRYVQLQSG